ncbi:MAG: BON domain-containing protein [Armatimonadetes bacterium]|nr:BON domain-containing protein [Armatimonadota bacterium]
MKWIPFLVLAVCVVGCNSKDANDITRDAGKLAETTVRSVANATVAVKVNTALSLRKGVHMENLHIESEGSTVTIGGHVETSSEKKLIMEIAKETRGVEKVVDDLRVEPKK